jgi:hypothetical protein
MRPLIVSILFLSLSSAALAYTECPTAYWTTIQSNIDWVINPANAANGAYTCAREIVLSGTKKALGAIQECNEGATWPGFGPDPEPCIIKACKYIEDKHWTPAC